MCTMEDERVMWMAELVTTLDGVTMDIFKGMVKNDPVSSKIIKDFLETASSGASLLFHCTSSAEPEQSSETAVAVETQSSSDTKAVLETENKDAAPPLQQQAPRADSGGEETAAERPKRLVASLNIVQESESALEKSCFYFLRVGDDAIVRDYAVISQFLEFGHITGVNSLERLRSLLSDVYVPLLNVSSGEDSSSDSKSASRAENILRSEFQSNLHKFCSQIDHALQQISGDVQLTIPNITIVDAESVTDDYEVVTVLEVALEDWSKLIANVVESETPKVPNGKGPLAEIEFWRARNATLSALYEQITMPRVQVMLEVLGLVDAAGLSTFRYHFTELSKLYIEAKDNVKFLTTLERHFKNISTGSISAILDTLPSMMNAIRMVWIISRHYNTDERMVPLMERIAREIANKVASEIDIHTILRKDPESALGTIKEGKDVLETWYSTYMNVREKIEQSGTDHRWEFDRKRLFEQSNYMARICENLSEVATVLDQFHKFLGPELKSVTGDSAGIDEVMARVEGLVVPLEQVPFDIFERHCKSHWDQVMEQFRDLVLEIETMTRHFINTSFQKLRSAEGAFDLLQNFQTIQSRDSINRQMMEKYNDTLLQYSKELERTQATFESGKADPPIFKNYPPVAGAIAWANALYLRTKEPIIKFRSMSDLLKSKQGEQVKEDYLKFARSKDAFVKGHFNRWKERVAHIVTEQLKQPILAEKGRNNDSVCAEKKQAGKQKLGHTLPSKNDDQENYMEQYVTNFSPALLMVMRESKYLDRMGFEVPEMALNVTLQEEKFHQYVQDLEVMLDRYTKLLNDLTPVESKLLKNQLKKLKSVLRAGFSPLNWNSQRIPSFIEVCSHELTTFQGMVSQINKSSVMINDVVEAVQNTYLVSPSDFSMGGSTAIEVSEFYEIVERNRLTKIEALVRKYHTVSVPFMKVEELVAGSNTGKSPALANYYSYWERRFFNAITTMIVTSMGMIQALLNIGVISSADRSVLDNRPPLCKVKCSLNGKDIVVSPPLHDIYKYMNRCMKHIVESAKAFVRWKRGTCIEAEPQIINSEDEEMFTFSFYSDVSQNPIVIKGMLSLTQEIHRVLELVEKYLMSWRRYETHYGLWNVKRRAAIEKVGELDPPPNYVYFDSRLARYSWLVETVKLKPTLKNIEFLEIDCEPVSVEIANVANGWKNDYLRILHQTSSTMLNGILDKMSQLNKDMAASPSNLEELKFVLNTVSNINNMSMDMELDYLSVVERYRTISNYGYLDVEASEVEAAMNLAQKWDTLVLESKTKNLRLVKVKEKFREVTKQDAVNFAGKCKTLAEKFYANGPGAISRISTDSTELDDEVEYVFETRQKLTALKNERAELVNAEGLFNLPMSSFPELQLVSIELDKLEKIYSLYSEFKEFEENMSNMLWADLDTSLLQKGIEDMLKKGRRFPKHLKESSTFNQVDSKISAFKDSIPLISSLKNDAMKKRHWDKLMDTTNVKFEMNLNTFKLRDLFKMGLHRFAEDIGEIVNEAQQEVKIENELRKIQERWSGTNFGVAKYTKQGTNEDRGYVLRSADEIRLELEDNMLNLQTMGSSRFVAIFLDDVHGWEKKLNHVSETIDVWFQVQRKWMYLESIFIGAEDIRLQLPEAAKNFDQLDKQWRTIMASVNKTPNVIEACHNDNRLDVFQMLSKKLDSCQKSLSDYLDTKRNAFPRFFFISDDELLSVLGSSDPTSIQAHLLKLFDNCKVFHFQKNDRFVGGMTSSEQEKYTFETLAPVEGAVEVWMTGVEDEMHDSLRIISKDGIFSYASSDRKDWLREKLGMVCLCGSQVWWTWEVEDTFRRVRDGNKYALKEFETKLTQQLNALVGMVRENLDKINRKKVNTLLIVDVHARDIVSSFVRDSILNEKEFAWESQLRFYWDKDVDDCIIRQCTGSFRYGYEYMGCNGRLVITPLTDRCYMTITQALTFKLGCSPAGPAGTGKTETVKDLAKNFALPCFVINCGEGLDYKAMGSIFSGLVQVGAWGCFDEFNRINIEVLSVVSAQIRAIQNSLNYGLTEVDIGMGQSIKIRAVDGFATCGIFITMNPGYAGRTELPDNLKALFRPVTMIVPDLYQICAIMLFSEGFEGAPQLAKKMTVLYRLGKEQLSKQYHYDFGLRALKSVLVMAGSLKRDSPDLPEDLVLMRALRDSNMPKFVFEDVPLFRGLINDLFPGLDCPRVGYPALKTALTDFLDEHNYHHSDELIFQEQVDKCIQMYETMMVRHTTMIVGPTGGSKTLVLQALSTSQMPAIGQSVKMFYVNPKAQTTNELYGTMDPLTRDWTDGVLSKLFRELNEELPIGRENEIRWLIFDGDVDAVWIENMNSVMDDNRLLTLPNGERIRLQNHCKMIMETFDLQYASPATISRCGMVWVDPKNLGFAPYYERWLVLRPNLPTKDVENELLRDMFDKYLPQTIDFILEGNLGNGEFTEKLKQVIPVSRLELVKQMCCVLDAFLCQPDGQPFTLPASPDAIEGIYVYCLVWSLGAALVSRARAKFEEFIRRIASISLPMGSLYEHYFDTESFGWVEWSTQVPEYVPPVPFEFHRVIVPTSDSEMYTFMLRKLAERENRLLFLGESGTAKTTTISNYMEKIEESKFVRLNVNFSSRTSSMDIQVNLEANIDKRTGRTYGPPAGKKLVVFIDDLNMPKVDTYGTQQPIALLLFLIDKGYMYDRHKDLELRTIKDLLYVGAMGPPGGGRNDVDPRFVARFNVFNLSAPTTEVLQRIYSSIVSAHFVEFDPAIKTLACGKMTDVLLKIYTETVEKMPPTPAKFHYIFNLRDLGRVWQGMCLATPDKFTSVGQTLRLFNNELSRIFSDRLISMDDKAVIENVFKDVFKETLSGEGASIEEAFVEPVLFGDFEHCVDRIVEEKEDPRLYGDVGDFKRIRGIFDSVLENYNMEYKPMQLVLFEAALDHLSRIHRIIRMPRGHALLVGVGGSGKQSLSRLAAFTASMEVFEITLCRGYGEIEFRDDLKSLFAQLSKGEVMFLFTDAHVVQEGFLEFVNNILTTGIVPALFENDEREQLISSVRNQVKAAGLAPTSDNCWNFYVDRCRNNLHMVLCMSPSGDTLRVRCRNFPGLVSACVIDWFFPWPAKALKRVGEFFLEDESIPDENRENVVDHMVHVHMAVLDTATQFREELRRYYYVTPKNYLDFISNYRLQLKENREKLTKGAKRLEGGLTKLVEAAEAVDRMQVDLKAKKIIVDEKTVVAETMIKEITEKSAIAAEQQQSAAVKQHEAEEKSNIINIEKAKADEALSEALPAVEAAAAALENLNKSDLVELKAFAQPPPLVKSVCFCVLSLRPTGQALDIDWKGAKVMLGNANLLRLLKDYEKDKITERMIRGVKKEMKNPDLNLDNMAKTSNAGYGLLVWVEAIVKYHEVAKNVEPLKNKVKTMEREQVKTETELAELNVLLKSLQVEIDTLTTNLSKANEELHELSTQAATMERRLTSAAKLLAGLSSERTRWTADVASFKDQESRLIGDCLLSAAFLSYTGAFTFQYRQRLVYSVFLSDVKTRELPLTDDFKLELLLTTDSEVQKWVGENLPADEHSIQNGILTTRSSRFPLCIDPQQQAVTWIKSREAANSLVIKTFNDSDFMKNLELAIQFGRPFLFENVGQELDPMIDPILEKNTYMNGTTKMIKIGDKVMDWDDDFRLYFTTKLGNPHYTPEIMGKTMIVNYSVTQQGLANQLLNEVVGHERPDLEEQYSTLVSEMSKSTQLIAQLEDTLLKELSSSKGNILDNEDLISTLEETKQKAVEIGAKLEQAKFTKNEISKTRSGYTPAALRGAIMYFAMAGLASISSMYEISLNSFLEVFHKALDAAKRDVVLENRLKHLISSITDLLYDYTCTGIFERHKLMFSFQMSIMIMEAKGSLSRPLLNFFLKGDTSLEPPSTKNPYSWVSNSGWKDLLCLATLGEEFEDIKSVVDKNESVFKQWYETEAPETIAMPMEYDQKLTPLQQLLVFRCFRPDRVYNAVKLFVMKEMGSKYIQPPVLDFERIFRQSSPTSPVVFILSPGADPQSDIQSLGDSMGFQGNKFRFLALGQGQGPLAEQMLEAGARRGNWVLLQNCHLLLSWLGQLEKFLELTKSPHVDFRLWLTTDPTDKFPLGILQRAFKVVTEPPDGLKQNMRSLYSKIDTSMVEECPHWAFRPLLYTLCFLHAVVLERRKYGKLGWNVNYDFNESDFNISRRLLDLYLTKAHESGDEMMPWGSLKYLIGDAMYGGRVSDNFDRRVLTTYMQEYMGDFLFEDCQLFCFSTYGFEYKLPEWGPLENYTKSVENLPLTNSPAVFGLHPNAEIDYFTSATKMMWHNLISLQPRASGSSSGLSREEYIANIARDIESKVPDLVDLLIVRKSFDGVPTPTQVVLLQELERWNKLIKKMKVSLGSLQKALTGEVGMSDALDSLGESLFNGFLPRMWTSLAPDTQKPLGGWMIHFTKRLDQYTGWVEGNEPAVMWLAGLHIPESYLTALVQTTCRLNNWPLDKSTLFTFVTKFVSPDQIESKLGSGCYVSGLYLEGAAWDAENSCLVRQEPKVLVTVLPILQVVPIEMAKVKLHNTLRTPVYVTQGRRNAMGVGLVFEADLATTGHPSHWVLQGVALSLNSDT